MLAQREIPLELWFGEVTIASMCSVCVARERCAVRALARELEVKHDGFVLSQTLHRIPKAKLLLDSRFEQRCPVLKLRKQAINGIVGSPPASAARSTRSRDLSHSYFSH